MDDCTVGLRHEPIGLDADPPVGLSRPAERESVFVLDSLPASDRRRGLVVEPDATPPPILERLAHVHPRDALDGAGPHGSLRVAWGVGPVGVQRLSSRGYARSGRSWQACVSGGSAPWRPG